MPVYLFTYHTYGSWLPDRPQGHVRSHEGILPADVEMADQYRRNMSQDAVLIGAEQQKAAIEILLDTPNYIDIDLHAVATEPTHIHALTSWRDDCPHDKISKSLKRALTINLKTRFGGKAWLSENRSREQVKDREHFDHLVKVYLPKHSGWNWNKERGYFKGGDG